MSSSLTTNISTPYVVESVFGDQLRIYSDGSIVRSPESLLDVPILDDGTAIWKEILFDATHNLHLRIYKPTTSTVGTQLPVLYMIPGGGFCIKTLLWPHFINECFRLASELQAIVIAPEYRLAPEHRLPAALEDGYTAIKWLQDQALSENIDPWLNGVADFGKVFICGTSAGGTIAHHLAIRLLSGSRELAPVRVRGYVVMEPFFGGTVRTKREAEGSKEAFLNLDNIDKFWKLSIPAGHTADHPLVNVFGSDTPSMKQLDLDPILVIAGGEDLLTDRVKEYARKLKGWGKSIEYIEYEGKQHAFFTFEPDCEASKKVMQVIKRFVTENSY